MSFPNFYLQILDNIVAFLAFMAMKVKPKLSPKLSTNQAYMYPRLHVPDTNFSPTHTCIQHTHESNTHLYQHTLAPETRFKISKKYKKFKNLKIFC